MVKKIHPLIKHLIRTLDADYIGEYSSGHMGSVIARFKRRTDQKLLVAKFPKNRRAKASLEDIRANISGFRAFRRIGAGTILPAELQVRNIDGVTVLTMEDLGESFRRTARSPDSYAELGRGLLRIASETSRTDRGASNISAGEEVKGKIKKYLTALSPIVSEEEIRLILGAVALADAQKTAFMPLDFTPDNVFLKADGLALIDPWQQRTYLGNPAVSMGQFATLAHDVYGLPSAEAGKVMLANSAIAELPAILGCSEEAVRNAFTLGSMLQFTLSAFVRRDTKPRKAREFAKRALELAES